MKRAGCRHLVIAGALVGAMTAGQSSTAAPVLSNSAAVRDAVPSDVVDVRHGNGAAFFGGLVLGGLIGGAIARPYYYPYPYYYGYYGYPAYPVYAPYYYGYPAYGYYPRYYRRHYHHYRR
jgi:hypothetical protein